MAKKGRKRIVAWSCGAASRFFFSPSWCRFSSRSPEQKPALTVVVGNVRLGRMICAKIAMFKQIKQASARWCLPSLISPAYLPASQFFLQIKQVMYVRKSMWKWNHEIIISSQRQREDNNYNRDKRKRHIEQTLDQKARRSLFKSKDCRSRTFSFIHICFNALSSSGSLRRMTLCNT